MFMMRKQANALLRLADISVDDIEYLIQSSHDLKTKKVLSIPAYAKNAVLVLYFEKRSTRTRLSCIAAWTKMGGTVVDLSPQEGNSHINVNESIYDSFRVISEMASCIVARVNSHSTLNEIVRAVNDSKQKPSIINGLSDKYHPLQVLADMQTMYEDQLKNIDNSSIYIPERTSVRNVLKGKKVAWIGDSNNVCNELLTTLPRFNIQFRMSIPPQYPFDTDILDTLDALNEKEEMDINDIEICDRPQDALQGVNFITTDTWVSMGSESEKGMRLEHFENYRICDTLLEDSEPHRDWKFLHCMPRKQEEVSDDIFYSDKSLVFEEAENRMWTVLALFISMLTTPWTTS